MAASTGSNDSPQQGSAHVWKHELHCIVPARNMMRAKHSGCTIWGTSVYKLSDATRGRLR
jgi:hypothetical protein